MQSERIVALIDVLGFSELVARQDFGELFEKYIDTVKTTIEKVDSNIEYLVFSDSIVIVTPDNEEQDLLNISKVIGSISYEFMVNQKLPIKGCIASGNITYKKIEKDVVIAGVPIVEAYKYEQQQDWVGTIISPNTARKFPSLSQNIVVNENLRHISEDIAKSITQNMEWNTAIQRHYQIPIKNSEIEDSYFYAYCVVPHKLTSVDATHVKEDLNEYLSVLEEQLLYAPEPKAQKKYRYTILFLNEIIKRWRNIWQSQTYRDVAWPVKEKNIAGIITRTQTSPERKNA